MLQEEDVTLLVYKDCTKQRHMHVVVDACCLMLVGMSDSSRVISLYVIDVCPAGHVTP
jgi:hypothetical protein